MPEPPVAIRNYKLARKGVSSTVDVYTGQTHLNWNWMKTGQTDPLQQLVRLSADQNLLHRPVSTAAEWQFATVFRPCVAAGGLFSSSLPAFRPKTNLDAFALVVYMARSYISRKVQNRINA